MICFSCRCPARRMVKGRLMLIGFPETSLLFARPLVSNRKPTVLHIHHCRAFVPTALKEVVRCLGIRFS